MRLQVAVFYLLVAAVIWAGSSTRGTSVPATKLAVPAPGGSAGVPVGSMGALSQSE